LATDARLKGIQVHTDFDGRLGNHGAVGLENDAANILEVVRVRDDLVAGEDVLEVRRDVSEAAVSNGFRCIQQSNKATKQQSPAVLPPCPRESSRDRQIAKIPPRIEPDVVGSLLPGR
jgi:hypothetical protein